MAYAVVTREDHNDWINEIKESGGYLVYCARAIVNDNFLNLYLALLNSAPHRKRSAE